MKMIKNIPGESNAIVLIDCADLPSAPLAIAR
jgi:hypothetical protein